MREQKQKGLHGWIRLLEGSQAATLAGLLKELDRLTASDDSSAIQLGEVLRKDASLTSHIIRIGNSIQFNPSSTPVTTVSRAIINIGFKHIRSVCLAVKVLELFSMNNASDQVADRLVTGLHSSFQARALCSRLNETEREEVFIACLLSQLVELLIVSSCDPEGNLYASKVEASTTTEERNIIANNVLGTRLDTLSKTLMKRWQIDGLINDLYNPRAVDQRLKAIVLGQDACEAVESGEDSRVFKSVLKKMVAYTGKTGVHVKSDVRAARYEALLAIKEFDDQKIITCAQRRLSDNSDSSEVGAVQQSSEGSGLSAEDDVNADSDPQIILQNDTNESDSGLVKQVKTHHDFDAQKQLHVSQKLTEMLLANEFEMNGFFRLLLRGVYYGAGFERCALLLKNTTTHRYVCKLSDGISKISSNVSVTQEIEQSASFEQAMVSEKAFIFKVGDADSDKKLDALAFKTGVETCLVAVLKSQFKPIGFLYADLYESKREIDTAYVERFNQLYVQSKLALNIIGKKS
ncbi:hypothetical protein A3715_01580 [Oleiphilus sp. HI0009]|nr:hypothetical protein A3715_01580 [Oleiphilus sp. HI0009]